MLALKRDIKHLKTKLVKKSYVHFSVNEEFECKIISPSGVREYKPVPTLKKLHKEMSQYNVVGVIGPYGSGKSVGLNFEAILIAVGMMPPCKDGVRRCKAAFVRNTYDELKQTTYEMFVSWFEELGATKSTLKPLEIRINFNDKKGPIELYIQFIALDKPKQYKKLRSSFFTFAYINEASESPEGIISQVLGRTGRYPSLDLLDTSSITRWFERDILLDGTWQTTKVPYWSGVLFDSNPPEVDSELFKKFEKEQPKGYKLFRQPPGLLKTQLGWEVNPKAENIERLGLDYYAKQAQGATEEFIRVFCCGEYGSIRTGQLIYEDYNDNIHCVENLEILEEVGLRLAFDTWYTPACNISQYAMQQLRVLAALNETHISMDAFVNEIIKPYLHDNFHGLKIDSITLDPAGMAGTNVQGATSDYQVLKRAFGGSVMPASTNEIKPRLAAVQNFLKRITKGKPAFVMDKKRCDSLRKGFLKHYIWQQIKSTGEIIYKPKKNMCSHNQDALQYEALSILPKVEEFLSPSPSLSNFLKPTRYTPQERYYA